MTIKSKLSLARMESIRSGCTQRSYVVTSAWHQSQESLWSQARLALKVQESCRLGPLDQLITRTVEGHEAQRNHCSVWQVLLQDKTFRVRALTRNASSPTAKAIAERGVEVVTADLSQKHTLLKVRA